MEHARWGKRVLFWTGLVLGALVVIEIALHIASAALASRGSADPRANFSSLKDKPWAAQFTKEFEGLGKAGVRYEPYTGWRFREYHSTYVNTDADGNRFTWNSEPFSEETTEVFVFGGSTTFGAGARDEYTIPSLISKALNAGEASSSARAYRVRNFGQPAYIFNQEIVALTQLLRAGERPDYVIFYDGGNEGGAAYDNGAAGGLVAEELIRQKYESTDFGRIVISAKGIMRDYCKICRGIITVGRAISLKSLRMYDIKGLGYSEEQLRALASAAKDDYLRSAGFLDGLARAYGFTYALFWQPSLLLEDRFVGDEEKLVAIDWRLQDEKFYDFHSYLTEAVTAAPPAHFYDVSGVLRDRDTQIYLDNVHVSEDGNAIVAARIAEDMKAEFDLP